MKRLTLLVLVAGLAASAQIITPIFLDYGPRISEQLKAFLELTDAQVAEINAMHADYGKFVDSKYLRQMVLNIEIGQETLKTPVDPMALGVRYAEIETIRRDIATEDGALRKRVLAKLTEAQKVKLTVLDQARKLQVEISDAVCQHMLEPQSSFGLAQSRTGAISIGLISVGYCGSYASFLLGQPTSQPPSR